MYRIRLTRIRTGPVPRSYSPITPRLRSSTGHAAAPLASSPSSARVASAIGLGGSGSGSVAYPAGLPATATGAAQRGQLNPRQLSAHLDEFVVGQERAKKVLAVAVYNHYARLQHLERHSAPASDIDPALEALHDDALSSSFATRDTRSPYPSAELPHVAQIQPRDRSRDLPSSTVASELLLTSNPAHLPPLDDSRAPSNLFNPSYIAPLAPQKRRTRSTDLNTTGANDPTNYTSPIHGDASRRTQTLDFALPSSSSVTPSRRPRKPRAPLTPTSPNTSPSLPPSSDLLTDFVGQVPGRVPPPPPPAVTSSALFNVEPDALVYEKSNVLLLGPTGSGKSLLARTLARCLDVPFVGVEATGLTMAGYVGEDVETCIHRLLVASDWDSERASRGIVFLDEVDKLSRSSSASYSKDVSGEGVQQALLKILEGTVVSVPDKEGQSAGRRGKGGATPPQHHLVDTTNILFILSGAFVGLEKLISKRIEKGSIGFTARIAGSGAEQGGERGQDSKKKEKDMLELVEPEDLVRFGFIPEFIGRLPVVATLKSLTEADLLRVLTEPKNALVRQYEDLFKTSDVQLSFTTAALRAVAHLAVTKGTGARGLRGILEKLLLEAMYTAPHSSIRYVLIDKDVALGLKPAHYYSRGQKHMFENDYAAEEGEDPEGQMAVGVEGESTEGELEGEGEGEREVEKRRATA